MSRRKIRAASILASACVLATLTVPTGARAGTATCLWGGDLSTRTGVFRFNPGLKMVPSDGELDVFAVAPLTGDDPRCTGTMTYVGKVSAGSSCLGFPREYGEVQFHDAEGNRVDRGITRFEGAGGVHSRSLLYGPDDELRGTVDPFARSHDQIPFTGACMSDEGLAEGTFGTTTAMLLLD